MNNVKMEVKGNELTIKIDLSADTHPSKSGKTMVIASTEGNKRIPDNAQSEIFAGVNVYRRR